MGVKVSLTRDEIFEAVFRYIKTEYPNMIGTQATILIKGNSLQGATVDCTYKKNEKNPFMPN